MGLCCSANDVVCEYCGIEKSYYRNHEHASRKSCRRFKEGKLSMDYHVWNNRYNNIFLHTIKYLKRKKDDYMVQGYVLEEEVRLPEWSKGSR